MLKKGEKSDFFLVRQKFSTSEDSPSVEYDLCGPASVSGWRPDPNGNCGYQRTIRDHQQSSTSLEKRKFIAKGGTSKDT